jgi:hypothetical protein
MANEATKKDLADLEKKINTKLEILVDSSNKALKAETDGITKTVESLNKAIVLYNAAITDLRKQVDEIRTVVNQHAKAINERD